MPEVRLIDANALKEKLKIDTNTATYSDYCDGYCDARQVDLDAIDAAPTIDAKPVRHGRWIEETEPDENGNVIAVCNQCYHTDEHCKNIKIQYCWNCGARMDADRSRSTESRRSGEPDAGTSKGVISW